VGGCGCFRWWNQGGGGDMDDMVKNDREEKQSIKEKGEREKERRFEFSRHKSCENSNIRLLLIKSI
jgi:hypothetical protein